jgi:hypothetical protein
MFRYLQPDRKKMKVGSWLAWRKYEGKRPKLPWSMKGSCLTMKGGWLTTKDGRLTMKGS